MQEECTHQKKHGCQPSPHQRASRAKSTRALANGRGVRKLSFSWKISSPPKGIGTRAKKITPSKRAAGSSISRVDQPNHAPEKNKLADQVHEEKGSLKPQGRDHRSDHRREDGESILRAIEEVQVLVRSTWFEPGKYLNAI